MNLSALEDLIRADRAASGPALDRALRTLHGSGDAQTMLSLHLLATEYWCDDKDQSAFHRTHAYVYALEAGDWKVVNALYTDLSVEGRI